MAEMLPDHPEIQMAMKTGYPSWNQPKDEDIYCDVCGSDITNRDIYCDEDNEHLCKNCLLFLHLVDY